MSTAQSSGSSRKTAPAAAHVSGSLDFGRRLVQSSQICSKQQQQATTATATAGSCSKAPEWQVLMLLLQSSHLLWHVKL